MGFIFDIHSARLYESWNLSFRGRAMDSFLKKHIPCLLEPLPGERVLDIGCGTGNHLIFFNKLGLDINGIDASPYMISRAGERLGNRCSLKTGMAEDLPFDDNAFDLSIMINTLEFLDDPLPALREACRVTKRKIFIGVMNSFSLCHFWDRFKGPFFKTITNHARSYNLWELKSYLRMAMGYVPIDWRCAQVLPFHLHGRGGFLSELFDLGQFPFGYFLGLSATVTYTMKADTMPLKLKVHKTGESIV